jgi:hypothetical protein
MYRLCRGNYQDSGVAARESPFTPRSMGARPPLDVRLPIGGEDRVLRVIAHDLR